MHKSEFKLIGPAGYLLFISALLVVFITALILNYPEMERREQLFMLYGGPFLIIAIIIVLRQILKNLNQVEVSSTHIISRNVLSRKTVIIELKELQGFKIDRYKRNIILLIDQNNKLRLALSNDYYKNLKEIIESLKVDYLHEA